MNPRLNRFRDKRLAYLIVFSSAVLIFAFLIPALKPPLLNILKFPFVLSNFIRREIGAIILYHYNLVQNEKLRKESDLLRLKLNSLSEVYLENKRLKDILDFKQDSAYKVIVARVIGRSSDNWSSAVIIDKGAGNGIKRGYVAMTYLGLVGRVVEATSYTSKIMLINDMNFGVSSIVQRSRQEGLVSGTLGGYLIMKYLPKDCDIKISDTVITSGLSPLFPKGLLIGAVIEIGEEFSGLSRYAIIKPAVNLSNIEEVLIIFP